MDSIERAIQYFEQEIRFCDNAPALNGCEMTEDWLLTRDACKLAVAALKEQQARQNPEPLTMKELFGMLGEPVWVVANHGGKGFWSIVSNSLLGVSDGFTAYRSKPDHFREVTKMMEVSGDG